MKQNDVDGSIEIKIDGAGDKIFLIEGFLTNEAEKNLFQTANLNALKVKLNGGIVTTTNKALDIANRIDSSASLLTETGIDLTSLDKNSTYAISATGNADGQIIVSVRMDTIGATTSASPTVTHIIAHKSDIDLVAVNNLEALKTALKGGVITQIYDTARNIATNINDVTSLKTETGIDLTALDDGSTYRITAIGDANGAITINIVMNTIGATTPTSPKVVIQLCT